MSTELIPESSAPVETAPEPIAEAAPEALIATAPEVAAVAPPSGAAPGVPAAAESEDPEPTESFADALSPNSSTATPTSPTAPKQLQGTVVSLDADSVFLDIGYKSEGVLPAPPSTTTLTAVTPGDTFPVSVKGRNAERYYELSRFKVAQPATGPRSKKPSPKDAVVGTVTAVVKGGLTVDVGVRAFMPASRSGTRDAAEMENSSAPKSPAASPSSTSPTKT